MKLPSPKGIELLHKKYAPSDEVFQEIWQHCYIVQQIARWCINNSNQKQINRALVEVGCLLHDIGVYKLYDKAGILDGKNYITHGIRGYELLQAEHFDEALCRFASHHTGVGITAQEIKKNKLALPVADYLAETSEERLVMYADKFHSKGPSVFNTASWYKSHVASQFGPEKVKLFEALANEFGEPPITEIATVYHQQVRMT